MATSNPTATPELTDAQRDELKAAKAASVSLGEMLTKRVKGVGEKIAEQALEAAGLKAAAKASREQLDRANTAETAKAGLRGKALALYVLTGKSNGGEAAKIEPLTEAGELPVGSPVGAPKTSAPAAQAATIADDDAQALFVEYLQGNVTDAPVFTDKGGKFAPTVDVDGILRVKAPHFQAWLEKNAKGVTVTRRTATSTLQAAGLASKNWGVLPQGFRVVYQGTAPKAAQPLPIWAPAEKDEAPAAPKTVAAKIEAPKAPKLGRKAKAAALVDAGIAADAAEAREQLADMGE